MEYQNNFSKNALLKRFVVSQFFLAAAIISIFALSNKRPQESKISSEHSPKVMANKATNQHLPK